MPSAPQDRKGGSRANFTVVRRKGYPIKRTGFLVTILAVVFVSLAAAAALVGSEVDLVSTTASGEQVSGNHRLGGVSSTGDKILIETTAAFLPSDTNGEFGTDLYVKHVTTGSVTLATLGSDGSQPELATGWGRMDGDADRVVFYSDSPMVSGDTNGVRDVFLRDLTAGTTERMSVSSNGDQADGFSSQPLISTNGRVVAFASDATNLVAGDVNGVQDVFVRDVALGVTERISVSSQGIGANSFSFPRDVSASGDVVLFFSEATNLADFSTRYFAHNRVTSTTTGISLPPRGDISGMSLSQDGSSVWIFTTDVSALENGDAFAVYRFDISTGALMELTSFPVPDDHFINLPSNPGPDGSWHALFSPDASRVAFSSGWIRMPASSIPDQGWAPQLYVHDIGVGETITVTLSSGGDLADEGLHDPDQVDFSADGLVVAFASAAANLVTSDSNPGSDIFRKSLPRSPFTDTGSTIFRNDIIWLAQQEITRGCATDLYCPDDLVTRGQMAAFLSRALDLPDPGDVDTFTDDDTSIFEDDIERIAAAGITRGCNPEGTRFCPENNVTRGEMAAFLVRALDLQADTTSNPFADDDGSIFEDDIEILAAHAITRGCNPEGTNFCPEDPISRGQMAAFLHRALTPP